jgi:rubrerythrin
LDAASAIPNTPLPSDACTAICGQNHALLSCYVTAVDPTALSVTVSCSTFCGTGRRPAGFEPALACETSGIGDFFAQLAVLESASVGAFRILRDELRAHGAPNPLVRAAERAARDELRHTRAMRALARRFGARPRTVEVARRAPRSLAAIALENAVEGCVRETYGALQATFQAQAARDPVVRAAMQRIARDETKHAALSFRVARWIEPRLDRAGQRRVEEAKQAAVRELVAAAGSPATSVTTAVGLPSDAVAAKLARQMRSVLWS